MHEESLIDLVAHTLAFKSGNELIIDLVLSVQLKMYT